MMTSKQLGATIDDRIKETKRGNLDWKMQIESTDDLSVDLKEKYIDENDKTWIVDECFVAYECLYKRQPFCMISYEHVLTCEDKTRMTCLIFLPPLGMRFFDVAELAPYAVDADPILGNKVHMLWEQLMQQYRSGTGKVKIQVVDPLNN